MHTHAQGALRCIATGSRLSVRIVFVNDVVINGPNSDLCSSSFNVGDNNVPGLRQTSLNIGRNMSTGENV